jgi:kinesin family protein 5
MPSPRTLDEALPDRVLVYARVKPASRLGAGDYDLATSCDVENVGTDENVPLRTLTVTNRMAACVSKSFSMDRVLGPTCTQKEVYEAVGAPVLNSVLQGCHGCVMAYGQTGSGKTHSMLNLPNDGQTEDAGIMPRLAVDLFTRIAADWGNIYEVQIAMIQIYNESAMDLLVKSSDRQNYRGSPPGPTSNPTLKATQRKPADGGGWELSECTWIRCASPEYLLECFRRGQKGLVYAETMMNKHSSRSHCVLQLRVNRFPRLDTAAEGTGKVELVQMRGLLTVVDMAGSERVKKTQSRGIRFNEATNINTSLLTFGNVVHALAKKLTHVPYRDSMLTKLLESSLSGLSRTALLVCVAPEQKHVQETTTALEFASRCMRVEAKPRVRSAAVEVDPATLARELAEEGSTFSAMDVLNKQMVSSQQQLDREKEERAEKEDQLSDIIKRERKERAQAETEMRDRIKKLEADVSLLQSQLDDARREVLESKRELTRALESVAAGQEKCNSQLARCEALERELEAERQVARDAVKRAESSAEDELRELLRRAKEEQATIQARLNAEMELERASWNKIEATLRAELEREREERVGEEVKLRETVVREKAEHKETEKQLRDALDRERAERAMSEDELRGALERETKERADVEEKLQLRVSELEAELASVKLQLSDTKRESLELDRMLSCARGDIAEVEDRFAAHEERIGALTSELEETRQAARRAAENAKESAAAKEKLVQELENKLNESTAAEQAAKTCIAEQREKVTSLTSELEEARKAARLAVDDANESADAEERILRRVQELEIKCQESVARADASDAAKEAFEEELLQLRAEWHEDLVELERASVTTSNEAEATARQRLASGLSVIKRGRNGKMYRRMIRCNLDTDILEWAPVGDFRKMSIKGAHIQWANDGSSFVIRGPKRDMEVEVTDRVVASWGRALHRRLPAVPGKKQLTPLRLVLGKAMQPGGFRSGWDENFPMSPASTAAATADIAAKKKSALHDAGAGLRQ